MLLGMRWEAQLRRMFDEIIRLQRPDLRVTWVVVDVKSKALLVDQGNMRLAGTDQIITAAVRVETLAQEAQMIPVTRFSQPRRSRILRVAGSSSRSMKLTRPQH